MNEMPKTLYHYCSCEAAFHILRGKSIWLSSLSNANDYAEGLWAQNIILEEMEKFEKSNPSVDLQGPRQQLFLNQGQFFVFCLSRRRNILSQWRAYADDGRGVAIGFDPAKIVTHSRGSCRLNNTPGVAIREIEYSLEQQRNIVRNILEQGARWPEGRFPDISSDLSKNQVTFKNPAFKEEEEIRLVTSPLILAGPKDEKPIPKIEVMDKKAVSTLQHRVANGQITAYFEANIRENAITEILLGPKNQFQQFDFDTFLSMQGYRHVKVSVSEATYR